MLFYLSKSLLILTSPTLLPVLSAQKALKLFLKKCAPTNTSKKTEDTTAKTVEVTYEKVNNVQMITVCQAGGYGPYGPTPHYCQEVAQETAYNVPIVTPVDVAVTVAYPEPQKVCVDKPISLPVVSCADITEEKTIKVPTVEDSEVIVPECKAQLGAPACQTVELTLPKQVCKELVYGHAHEAVEHPPHPAHPAHAA